MPDVRISWISRDGEEREETWPSVERFRVWAQSEGQCCSWTAYEEEDGEWVVVDSG